MPPIYSNAPLKTDPDWDERFVVENDDLPAGEKTQMRTTGSLRDEIISYARNNEYEVDFGTVAVQSEFTISSNQIGDRLSLVGANIALYVDYGRRLSTEFSIDPVNPLRILSVDPQTSNGWEANSLYFIIKF